MSLAEEVGGCDCFFEATTSEFGQIFGVSQQSASRYLMLLEKQGWITRARSEKGFKVSITDEGVSVLKRLERKISSFLNHDSEMTYVGEVVSGIGEGAYYVSKYAEKINETLGYSPYPGTLNVRVHSGKPDLDIKSTIKISGFTSEGRSYGGVGLTPIVLTINRKTIHCHAIIPERTHHKLDLELISKHNFRKEFKAADGDEVRFTVL